MQSVVKSHLDAIPEDRKAIDKGGGNAVQKLHEVEKYIRKNKLKVPSYPPLYPSLVKLFAPFLGVLAFRVSRFLGKLSISREILV